MVKTQSDTGSAVKKAFMLVLGLIAAALIFSGAAYSIYSVIHKTSFHVLNTNVPGYIFGAIDIFLGVRYIKAIIRLNKNIESSGVGFSWGNFKKGKK